MPLTITQTHEHCFTQTAVCHIQPITLCSFCNKTKVSDKSWLYFADEYIHANDPMISHGFCPDCARKHFPTLDWD